MPRAWVAASAEPICRTMRTTSARGRRPRAAQPALQVLALEELHHQVGLARRRGAEVGDLHDVGVRQLREDLGLAVEPGERLPVGGQLPGHDLDREPLAQAELLRFVDGPHPAFGEPPHELVRVAQDRAQGQGAGMVALAHAIGSSLHWAPAALRVASSSWKRR